MIDGNGEIISAEDLDMWGYRMADRSFQSDTTFYKYTGKERDVTTGYDYFGARYYVSRIGNWTSVDPLFEKHYDFSPYNYVLRNPLNLIDPDGRQVRSDDDPEKAVGAIALSVALTQSVNIASVVVGGAAAVAIASGIYLGQLAYPIIFDKPTPATTQYPMADPIHFVTTLPDIVLDLGIIDGLPAYQLIPGIYVFDSPSHVGLIPPYEMTKGGNQVVFPTEYEPIKTPILDAIKKGSKGHEVYELAKKIAKEHYEK